MGIKNIYFDTWEEYVNFIENQQRLIDNVNNKNFKPEVVQYEIPAGKLVQIKGE